MTLHYSLFLFLTLIILSCKGGNDNNTNDNSSLSGSVDSLYKLVVAKHDEVMPKTADISKLSRILRSDMENMGEDQTEKIKKETILGHLSALQQGHDAMFDWMGDFKGIHTNEEFYKKNKDQVLLEYLKEEEIKIDRVAKLMLESIGNAEIFLKENGSKQ